MKPDAITIFMFAAFFIIVVFGIINKGEYNSSTEPTLILTFLIIAIIVLGKNYQAKPNNAPTNYSAHSEFIHGHIR
jgi:uncharacterized ion transporter superfamily protein YfcC